MTYDELVAASIAYADRQDIEVTANMDTFILLVEARINRLLKTREQSNRIFAPTVEDQEYYCLPDDYAGMRDIQLNTAIPTEPHKVQQYHYLSPEQMNVQRGKPYGGTLFYTVIGNRLQIYPCQPIGKAIELVYFQKVPNLTTALDGINWMSDSHPDIYVAGMTAEIELFAKNQDLANTWFERLKGAIAELDTADIKERWAGQALVTRAG